MAFTFKHPEEIDAAILAHINSMPRNGGKNTKNQTWDGELLELRNMVVYDYIRQGLTYRRCCEEIANRWNISMKTAEKYYKEAMNSLVVESEEVVDEARKIAIERITGIIEDCINRGLYDQALRAQDQLNKINALYTEKKEVEVTGLKFDFGERE